MQDSTAVELAILGDIHAQCDLDSPANDITRPRPAQLEFYPIFASQPASKFETHPLPMIVQPRIADEGLETIFTGYSGNAALEEQGLLSLTQPTPPAKPMYIPEEFPFTHSHIGELGNWPQRLLHVPSMTSYEWQPGNIYGGCKEPKYRAISYTWGRWELKAGKKPKVKQVLEIKGVPWTIPRIDPGHFTTKMFENVIKLTCTSMVPTWPCADFLWLDLACIDQRWGPLAALEVGRQAVIFEGATGVAAWLSQSGKDRSSVDRLGQLFSNFGELSYDKLVSNGFRASQQQHLLLGLRELLCDPWFSSLWTLQEAVLSHNALLISAQAVLFSIALPEKSSGISLCSIDVFADMCQMASRWCKTIVSQEARHDPDFVAFANELSSWTQKSGLDAMGLRDNFIALLTPVRFRKASEDQDHIYGIMQVFGYRLGTSDPNSDQTKSYTRAELADQLGAALLQDRPIRSQLHVFTEPVDRGNGWHISPSSIVPEDYILYMPHDNTVSGGIWQSACSLSTAKVGAKLFGHFKGKLCWFSTLRRVWEMVDLGCPGLSYAPSTGPICSFFPDVSEHVIDSSEYRSWSPIEIPALPERQHAFGWYLQNKFESNRLAVLFLGTRLDLQRFGLILLHVNVGAVSYWHRLGTCRWYHVKSGQEHPAAEKGWRDLLIGTGQFWIQTSGIFG